MQLIALLRAAGELDALRAQREATSEIFAMPPKFWMEWIEYDLILSVFFL